MFYQKETPSGTNILEMFDSTVRKSFQERKNTWLCGDNKSAEIPMLTSYILNKCKQWADMPKVIQDTRESKIAKNFRSSLNYLLKAEARHENRVVDEILVELSNASEQWSKNLNIEGTKRKITWTVPVVGISTDIELPDKGLSKSHGEKMLLFIHEILASA